ncbi:MAG: NAD(P)H-hydrate epimerase [Planctomycetota bacterium]|jgi:NAD(P)H-hydrate epimerase
MIDEKPQAVTAAEIREMDRVAIEEFGVPGVVLMENAGAGAASVARAVVPEGGKRFTVLAGKGNNGGDGFVVARHLLNRGAEVSCVFAGDLETVDPATDAGINLFVLLKMGVLVREILTPEDVERILPVLEEADLVVDGLLGTGTKGRIREPYAALIDQVNELPLPALALDLPSGLDADTGEVLGHCLQAAHTATFVAPKKGFALGRGPALCGTVHVIDIGMPRLVFDQVLERMRESAD